MKYVFLAAVAILLPISGSAWAVTDLSTIGSPEVSIFPASGTPGTNVTITVSNIPDISQESYPYTDLYIYLPFSQSFGTTPQSQCGGEDCFPIYTHDDAVNHDVANRIVQFALFSTANSSPVYLNGFENSPCDVTVNGKTLERYSTLCNTKNQPTGTYQIKFAWAEENAPQINYVVKKVQFTVTPGSSLPPQKEVDNGNSIIQEYQNGQISQSEFYSKLSSLGWNSEEIRQALATIGKLPQQMGAPAPNEMQQIQQGIEKASEQYSTQPKQATPQPANQAQPTVQPSTQANQAQPSVQSGTPVTQEQTAESLAPYKAVEPEQQQAGQSPVPASPPQTSFWTMITVLASVGAASAVGGSIVVARHTRKVTN